MARAIHTFENGVRVYEDQLLEEQRLRYRRRNVHEAEEEEIFVELIRRLPADGCFVDIGAAIGYYLILARKLAPGLEIHGVEPLERHRQFLRENLPLNGVSPNEFVIHPEGLTSSAGNQKFVDRGYGSRIAQEGENKPVSLSQRWKRLLDQIGLRKPKSYPIATITLDLLVSRIARRVDLLQMDVQGLEVEVLKGGAESLRNRAIKTFLIGTHGRARGWKLHEECREILQANGYAIEIDQPDTREQPDGILVARHAECDSSGRGR